MNIKEIYERFNEIGCVVFSTIDGEYPMTRIAHFYACDEEGLYFRTMKIKPFYNQLNKTKKVSVCGMSSNTEVSHDDKGMPTFDAGYTIRVTGDVKEVSFNTLEEKAKKNKDFLVGVKDTIKYPNTASFCLYRGYGEVFDYDFEMISRDNKLIRIPFHFNGIKIPFRGLKINDNCIGCGACFSKCSFKAIEKDGEKFKIDPYKCDLCGDCYSVCNHKAIDTYME